mgnify:CR=1 FL=1
MSEKGICAGCGKEIYLERTGKHCSECFDERIHFCWIQESRTGRSSRYWDDEE